jgi:SAM-dependent methyltransferase
MKQGDDGLAVVTLFCFQGAVPTRCRGTILAEKIRVDPCEIDSTGITSPAMSRPTSPSDGNWPAASPCEICGSADAPAEMSPIRCNIRKFRDKKFNVWRCAACRSLHCEKVADLAPYYAEYPLRREVGFNYFMDQWFRVVLRRLLRAGLQSSHSILDYGCGNGLLIDYLARKGYGKGCGYDPFVETYKDQKVLHDRYDWVLCFDVIEHVESPRRLIEDLRGMLKPDGRLCVFTPKADGIRLSDPEEFIHQLHTPCHLHILSEQALLDLGARAQFAQEAIYLRWYQDSWMPLTSRRFIELFMRAQGNDMDSAFDPPNWRVLSKMPLLWLYAFFGYFLPTDKDDTMMIIFKQVASDSVSTDC